MWTKKWMILFLVVIAIFGVEYTGPHISFCAGYSEPQTSTEWNKKGNDLYSQGKYDEALEAFDKAIELDPQNANAWYGKGNTLTFMSLEISRSGELKSEKEIAKKVRYYEALEAFDKAIELDPQNANAWYGKAHALTYMERSYEARFCYDMAHKVLTSESVT